MVVPATVVLVAGRKAVVLGLEASATTVVEMTSVLDEAEPEPSTATEAFARSATALALRSPPVPSRRSIPYGGRAQPGSRSRHPHGYHPATLGGSFERPHLRRCSLTGRWDSGLVRAGQPASQERQESR